MTTGVQLQISNEQTIPPKIYWHEGMLLSQHLFQQNDLRYFQTLSKHLSLISPWHWGIIELDIDKSCLSEGLYKVNKIKAVFQDGLYFEYKINMFPKEKPLEIKLKDIDRDEFYISLVIAAQTNQLSPLLGSNPRFYAVDGVSVKDENLVDNETVIPRLMPNVFLHAGLDIPEGCIGFPISHIFQTGMEFVLSSWTPPCFCIPKNSEVWKQCFELITSFDNKLNILEGKILNSDENTSFSSHQLLIQLAEKLIPFKAFLSNEYIKPYDLFCKLIELTSSIITLDENFYELFHSLPTYNHNGINECILPLLEIINKNLSVIDHGYEKLIFNKREHFFYKYISQRNIDGALNKKLYIGICSTTPEDFSNITSWMKNAIIVSDFALDNVRLKRIQGATRRELKSDEVVKISPKRNTKLFEIDIDPQHIQAEQNLHIFNPGDDRKFQPKEIMLYIPQSKNGKK